MKKPLTIIVIGMIILTGVGSYFPGIGKSHTIEHVEVSMSKDHVAMCANAEIPSMYVPENMTLEDNGYSPTRYPSIQWWYFDAVFDTNYSIQIGMMIISKNDHGVFLLRLNILKDGILEFGRKRFIPLRWIDLEESDPLIRLFGTQIMHGYVNESDTWIYDVSVDLGGGEADLQFVGLTKGWKGYTGRGWWGATLPKARVQGSITLNGVIRSVTGVGYHEHAWDATSLPQQWYWLKIVGEETNVIVTKNMKNRWEEGLQLAVFNYGETEYVSINPDNIEFSDTESISSHGRRIPVKSVFRVDDGDLQMNITIEMIDFHYEGLFMTRYWLYHARVTGVITYKSTTESIDNVQIMEFIIFR